MLILACALGAIFFYKLEWIYFAVCVVTPLLTARIIGATLLSQEKMLQRINNQAQAPTTDAQVNPQQNVQVFQIPPMQANYQQ